MLFMISEHVVCRNPAREFVIEINTTHGDCNGDMLPNRAVV